MERSKCIITLKMHVFEHHMYIGNEEELYIHVYTVTCMHCRYIYSPSAHASTLYNISTKSKYTVVLHWLQNTWQNTEFTAIHYNYTGPLTHNMNMYLLCALIQSAISQHQETAVSHNSVYRESVSDSHNDFSCCTVDPLLLVCGSIQDYFRTINLPTR